MKTKRHAYKAASRQTHGLVQAEREPYQPALEKIARSKEVIDSAKARGVQYCAFTAVPNGTKFQESVTCLTDRSTNEVTDSANARGV